MKKKANLDSVIKKFREMTPEYRSALLGGGAGLLGAAALGGSPLGLLGLTAGGAALGYGGSKPINELLNSKLPEIDPSKAQFYDTSHADYGKLPDSSYFGPGRLGTFDGVEDLLNAKHTDTDRHILLPGMDASEVSKLLGNVPVLEYTPSGDSAVPDTLNHVIPVLDRASGKVIEVPMHILREDVGGSPDVLRQYADNQIIMHHARSQGPEAMQQLRAHSPHVIDDYMRFRNPNANPGVDVARTIKGVYHNTPWYEKLHADGAAGAYNAWAAPGLREIGAAASSYGIAPYLDKLMGYRGLSGSDYYRAAQDIAEYGHDRDSFGISNTGYGRTATWWNTTPLGMFAPLPHNMATTVDFAGSLAPWGAAARQAGKLTRMSRLPGLRNTGSLWNRLAPRLRRVEEIQSAGMFPVVPAVALGAYANEPYSAGTLNPTYRQPSFNPFNTDPFKFNEEESEQIFNYSRSGIGGSQGSRVNLTGYQQ